MACASGACAPLCARHRGTPAQPPPAPARKLNSRARRLLGRLQRPLPEAALRAARPLFGLKVCLSATELATQPHRRVVRLLHSVHHLAGAGIQKVHHAVAGGGDVAVGPPRDAPVALPRRQRQAGGEQYLGVLVHVVPHIDVPHLSGEQAGRDSAVTDRRRSTALALAGQGVQGACRIGRGKRRLRGEAREQSLRAQGRETVQRRAGAAPDAIAYASDARRLLPSTPCPTSVPSLQACPLTLSKPSPLAVTILVRSGEKSRQKICRGWGWGAGGQAAAVACLLAIKKPNRKRAAARGAPGSGTRRRQGPRGLGAKGCVPPFPGLACPACDPALGPCAPWTCAP